MVARRAELPATSFADFGTLLRVLRRRARLTQRDLGIAVGYSEAQISRLEQGKRLPDPSVVAALFVPALGVAGEPELAGRLHALARDARGARDAEGSRNGPDAGIGSSSNNPADGASGNATAATHPDEFAAIPAAPVPHVPRPGAAARLGTRLGEQVRVLLCGPPGTGKTTLAAATARDLARERPVCWLTLTEGITTPAEAVIRRLARGLDRAGQPEAAPLLGPGQRDRPLPFDEQMYLLVTGLSRAGVVVFLDNAHLLASEDRTRTVVEHLAGASRAGFVAISREDFRLDGFERLTLGGLDRGEARTLIGELAGDLLPIRLAGLLIDRTEGSPMLIRLALSAAGGTDPDRPEPEPATLIERLEAQAAVSAYLLRTTLAGLSRPALMLTSLLAVFRHPVDLLDERLLDASTAIEGRYDVMTSLEELRRRQLVDHAARASLHPLVRDHVYAGLAGDPDRRRALHRLAAAYCEPGHGRPGDPLEAAWHYARAGDRGEAADLLAASVRELVASGRAERAADLVTDLLAQAHRTKEADDERIRQLLVARGDLLLYTERAELAEQSYRDALARPAPPAVRADVTWRMAQSLLQRGQVTEALTLSEQAADALTGQEDMLRAQLAVVRSQAHLMLSDFDAAAALATSATRSADKLAAVTARTAAEIRCRARGVMGVVARLRGQTAEALTLFDQSLADARATGRAELTGRALFNFAALAHEQGDLARAERLYTEALTITGPIGDSYGTARVLHALGMIRHQAGAADEAISRFTESIALRRRLGDIQGAANSEHSYALVLLWLGRTGDARDLLASAIEETTKTGERRSLGHLLDTQAMIALVDGQVTSAAGYLDQAADIAGAIGERRLAQEVRLHRAMTALAGGDLATARELAAEPAGPAHSSVLQRLAIVACIALAAGDRGAALEHAADLSRHATAHGFVPEIEAARRIAAAAAAGGPPAAGYPKLVWVTDRAAQTTIPLGTAARGTGRRDDRGEQAEERAEPPARIARLNEEREEDDNAVKTSGGEQPLTVSQRQ